MIAIIKRLFKGLTLAVVLGLGIYSVLLREGFVKKLGAETTSREQLQAYSGNLDILRDKTGNLDTLIGEVQGYRTYIVTGAVVGTTVSVPGILPTDTIREVIVHTSAAFVCGSTVIGKAGDGQIQFQSKIWGDPSFQLNVSVTQKLKGDISSETLTINTTGYAIEIKLASGSVNTVISSANAIVEAIRADSRLNRIISVSTLAAAASFSTASFTMPTAADFTNQFFQGNSATGAEKSYRLTVATTTVVRSEYPLPGSAAVITSSGNVVFSSSYAIRVEDGIELKTIGKR